MNKIICFAAAMLAAGACTAYGAEVDYNRADGRVTVSGDGLDYGKTVRMVILKPGADYEQLINGEKTFVESCIHIAELKQAKGSGEYEFPAFTIKEGTPPGEYTAVIVTDTDTEQIPIDYASVSQALGFITDADDAEEVSSFIERYNDEVYKLPVGTDSEYYKLDSAGQEYVLSGLTKEAYADTGALLKRFNEKVSEYLVLYRRQAFSQISNLSSASEVEAKINQYEKVYGLNRSEDSLFAALDQTGKKAVYEKMTGEAYTCEEDIQLAFNQKTVLYYIQQGPWGSIPQYIKDYNDILKLDLTKYSSSNTGLLKHILGKSCKTPADLQRLIDNYTQPSGGGGSSGGDRISPAGGLISAPVPLQKQTAEPQITSVFSDVPVNHWAFDSVKALYERNIINGKSEKLFAPDDYVTRAEAVKMIVTGISDGAAENTETDFVDVPKDSWEYEYVSAASALGIIKGYDDGAFEPDACITRQDLCVMIYRAMQQAGYEISSGVSGFTDGEKIADYAAEAVNSLASGKVISGMGDGSFCPEQNATRAETAKIIYMVIK
ncbi:MAG: S-layer homology domain-containing protein [Clostridia bacterium]|nr:S-layer homology domain-containing protein [Clostridia bacterium]